MELKKTSQDFIDFFLSMYWLFSETTAYYPSLYLKYNDMYSTKRQRFIKGRLEEALRVAQGVPVYPYVWYKYHDNHQFVTKVR